MTVTEIKQAVDSGHNVQWASTAYRVIKDRIGQYLIICLLNDYCIGLTHMDGITLNGSESEFTIVGMLHKGMIGYQPSFNNL